MWLRGSDMKNYELNAGEIELVLSALRYTTEHGFTMIQTVADDMEYVDMRALIERLEPKPVKKNAWMVVYDDESRSRLFDYQDDAKQWAGHAPEKCKVVKVTWEE
jgi:hypothetical protein